MNGLRHGWWATWFASGQRCCAGRFEFGRPVGAFQAVAHRCADMRADMETMRANLRDTDSYLTEWRRATPVEVSDDLQTEADKKAAELEATFDEAKLKALVESGGVEKA